MGEAKRRKAEIERLKQGEEAWLAGLTPHERTASEMCRRAHTQIVERGRLVGGCYLLAFFLNELLYVRHAIETELVVGWVNDGTWLGVGSHAWIELGGKKIDISLTLTEQPDAQPPGELIILDRVVRTGTARYSYYREPSAESLSFLEQLVREGNVPREAIEEKNREHAYVSELARSRGGIRTFLSRAPPDRSFETLARRML